MTTTMELCSNALRGLFVAAPSKKLVVADLKNIEGRVLPWMAGEEWKLQAFRDYDAGTGFDLYVLAIARALGLDPAAVTKFQRQIGKVIELAMGYAGGVGAFVTMAATVELDLDALTVAAWGVIPYDVMKIAEWMWEKAVEEGNTFGLRRETYIVCDSLKTLWRRAHPAIAAKKVGLWDSVQNEVRSAIQNPAGVYGAGRCTMRRTGNWLRIRLPSGRTLSYPSPCVDDDGGITYMGVNQYSHRWSRIRTYGGKLVENIDQAIARDVLGWAMPRAEAAGYQLVLTVHDELVTETPDEPRYNAEALSAILAQGEEWTEGLPLAAAGFEGKRYRKE